MARKTMDQGVDKVKTSLYPGRQPVTPASAAWTCKRKNAFDQGRHARESVSGTFMESKPLRSFSQSALTPFHSAEVLSKTACRVSITSTVLIAAHYLCLLVIQLRLHGGIASQIARRKSTVLLGELNLFMDRSNQFQTGTLVCLPGGWQSIDQR
jgi:hypothetical protein